MQLNLPTRNINSLKVYLITTSACKMKVNILLYTIMQLLLHTHTRCHTLKPFRYITNLLVLTVPR